MFRVVHNFTPVPATLPRVVATVPGVVPERRRVAPGQDCMRVELLQAAFEAG